MEQLKFYGQLFRKTLKTSTLYLPFIPNRFSRNAEFLTQGELKKNKKKLVFHKYPSLVGRTFIFGSAHAGLYLITDVISVIADLFFTGGTGYMPNPNRIYYVVGGWSLFYAWMSHSLYLNNIKKLKELKIKNIKEK